MKLNLQGLVNVILALIASFTGVYALNNVVDLNLIYHFQQSLALLDVDYFLRDLMFPAGLSNYMGTVLTDFWGTPWLGLTITFFLLSSIPVFEYIRLRKASPSFSLTMSLVLFVLWILVFIDYYVQPELFFAILFSYLLILIARFIINKIHNTTFLLFLLIPLIFLIYLFTGSVGLILFLILSLVSLLHVPNSPYFKAITIVSLVLSAFLIPFLLSYFFYPLITPSAAYFSNFEWMKTSIVLYICIGVVLILNTFFIDYLKARSLPFNKNVFIITSFLMVLLLGITPNFRLKKDKKEQIKMDYLAHIQNWEELLKLAKPEMMHDRILAFQINRALYYSGGLLENLFAFPQYLGNTSLLLEKDTDDDVLMPVSDIYYDMGYLNESRHWANEALTRYGKQPRIFKRLTQINIVYGNYNGARKYIELLKKTHSHKKWALEQEPYLFNTDKVLQNSEYARLIDLIPNDDFFASKSSPHLNLVNMNKYQNNPMIFEYMMAYTMLEHNLGRLVKHLPEFQTLKYDKLPDNVQQALGIYMAMTHTSTIDMAGYKFSESFNQQFMDYTKTYAEYKKGGIGSQNSLNQKYRNTFWYYIHFISPVSKK